MKTRRRRDRRTLRRRTWDQMYKRKTVKKNILCMWEKGDEFDNKPKDKNPILKTLGRQGNDWKDDEKKEILDEQHWNNMKRTRIWFYMRFH